MTSASLPIPADRPDLEWRPLTPGDHPAVVAVDAAIDRVEHLSDPMSLQTAAAFLAPPWVEPELDTIGAFDGGELVGYAAAMGSSTERGNRVIAFFETTPDALDLEPHLLTWSGDRGRRLIAGGTPGVESMIRISVDDHRTRRKQLLETAGFLPARTFVEMARALDTVPPEPELPAAFRMEPWSPERDEAAREASNAAFAGHWGSLPMTPDQWRGLYMDNPGFRADLSFLAFEGDRVVGLCMIETEEERDERVGFTEAWIHRLGTVPDRQRLGIGRALMARSMAAIRGAGIGRAALGVDELGEAGALALYERLGFEVELRTIEYVVAVESPAAI